MKKPVLLISAICVSACALSACNACGEKEVSVYDNLNSMLVASYSQISISVENTFTDADITLESVYVLIYGEDTITVQYRVERLSGLSYDNPTTEPKYATEGTAVISDGMITGGNDVGLTVYIANIPLEFNEKYFSNIVLDETSLSADVTKTSEFLGSKVDCTDMKVIAKFSDVLESITVTYNLDSQKVEYRYVFTR